MAIDPDTFKPTTTNELLSAVTEVATAAAGGAWKNMENEVKNHLTFISSTTLETAKKLAAQEITQSQADHTLHLLEYNFNATLLLIQLIPYVVAQAVLNAVFGLVNSVVKNYAGVDLGFGGK